MNEETRADENGEAHCALGPSTLPARAVCPCHESAPGGADAQSGTRSHKVVEANIVNGQSCTPPDPGVMGVTESPEMMGVKPADNYLPGTTEDEIGRGVWGANMIKRLRDETAPGAYIHTETRAKYVENTNDQQELRAAFRGKFGTVDAFWESVDGTTLYIADYKTYAVAESEKSYLPQGMAYAALLESERKPYKRARFYVIAGGNRTVAQYDFALDDAKRETAATIRRVSAVLGGGDVFASAEEARAKCGKPSAWCNTCAHAATCPAISRAVTMVSSGGILEKPLAVRMAVVPVLESFVKRVKAEVRAELDAGRRVYDAQSGIEYALAERRGRGRLADLRGLAESLIAYGVEADAIAAAVSVSKSAVDELCKGAEEARGATVKKAEREAVYLPFFTVPGMEKYVKRIS